MTSTALELKEQPRAVQFLYRQASLPASIIPKALQLTPKDSPEKRAQKEADRLMWALTAHSLGLDIGTAVKHVAVISGAPVVSAEMARRVAMEQGCEIEIVDANDQGATVRGRRRGGSWSTVSFTRRDAERAGFYDITWELGWGNSTQTWQERWFDIIDERMVRADEATRPKWASSGNKDAKRKFREAYFRWPTAMFLARASTLLTRTIAPVATIAGVPLMVDEMLDEQAARDAVVVEGESVAQPDADEDDIVDGELIELEHDQADVPVTPAQVADAWSIAWKAACTGFKIDKATSAALLSYAAARDVSLSSEVTAEAERVGAMEAARLWSKGELVLVDGRIVEAEASA